MVLRVPYDIVDVFTTEPFGGNQLAVVPDARGLNAAQMANIAREFNFSETTFVLPPKDAANTAQVRIFTPTDELPFAGHPNVGTAFVLARAAGTFGPITDGILRFEEGAGLVPVKVFREAGTIVAAELTAPRPLEIHHARIDAATVGECIGLTPENFAKPEPVMASVGLAFVLAELRNIDALARAVPNPPSFRTANKRYPSPHDGLAIYAYVRDGDGVTARMFAPLSNIREDPATGSAAAALAAYLASRNPAADLEQHVTIAQGAYCGRPSTLSTTAVKRGGKVEEVRVRGNCVAIATGVLTLP